MADVELVIKIPEELKEVIDNTNAANALRYIQISYSIIYEAIKNGIPLPKGHGDLIDRGGLKTHFIGTEQGTDLEVYLEPIIINAPPIIKAYKERDEKNNE